MASSARKLIDRLAVPAQPSQSSPSRIAVIAASVERSRSYPRSATASAAHAARIEPVEQGRARPADMQEAGWRRGKACDDGTWTWMTVSDFAERRVSMRARAVSQRAGKVRSSPCRGRRAIARAAAGVLPGWRSHADGSIAHGLDPRPALQRWWALEIEHRRLFNLLPVGMGVGVCLYFAADVEPALWAPAVALACSPCSALWLVRRSFRRADSCAWLSLPSWQASCPAGFAAIWSINLCSRASMSARWKGLSKAWSPSLAGRASFCR